MGEISKLKILTPYLELTVYRVWSDLTYSTGCITVYHSRVVDNHLTTTRFPPVRSRREFFPRPLLSSNPDVKVYSTVPDYDSFWKHNPRWLTVENKSKLTPLQRCLYLIKQFRPFPKSSQIPTSDPSLESHVRCFLSVEGLSGFVN